MYFTIEISDYYGVEESPGARVGISNSIAVRWYFFPLEEKLSITVPHNNVCQGKFSNTASFFSIMSS